MICLREAIHRHGPVLLLDAASSLVQAGWFIREQPAQWQTSAAEAGIAVFDCVERLGVAITDARAFVFCEGPGSILGVRTVAMALRTWNVLQPRPVLAYGSIALVAHGLREPDTAVIADARRDSWHHYQPGHGLRRVPTKDLEGNLATPEHFRNWTSLPANVRRVSYDLRTLWPAVMDAPLLRPTETPDAYLHEEPSYVTWTPQIHRAPASR